MKKSLEILEKFGNLQGMYVERNGKMFYQGIATFNYQVCVGLLNVTKENEFNNRRPLSSHRTNLLSSMKKGKWQVTGQTIVMDENGSVIDGGHRISAVANDRTKESSFESFFVIGVETSAFNNIDSGRTRTASQLVEIALQGTDITTKGLTINAMVKADRTVADYLSCRGKKVLDFYDINRKTDPLSRPERVSSLVNNPQLKVSFELVQKNLEVENKIRKSEGVKSLKLGSNTRVALAVLGSVEEDITSFEDFLSTVFSYKNQQEYYTTLRDDDMAPVHVGKTKANKVSVLFVHTIQLYRKYKTAKGKDLLSKLLTDPTITLL